MQLFILASYRHLWQEQTSYTNHNGFREAMPNPFDEAAGQVHRQSETSTELFKHLSDLSPLLGLDFFADLVILAVQQTDVKVS